ncbi:hypothetical protein L6164_018140 [Bauhinia variegata]|uniref:Uncharacterized protein n=1 Tax=Bauhinia variegata TaxID=167791 RepID=A0ACB9NA24_BAUVA|nr:hypothetical protein L6164_018140 [Bauhinia variegata]
MKKRAALCAATEENSKSMATEVDFETHPKLLSFLEEDDSFLTLWNWNPNALESKEEEQHLQFQSGSFFAEEVSGLISFSYVLICFFVMFGYIMFGLGANRDQVAKFVSVS